MARGARSGQTELSIPPKTATTKPLRNSSHCKGREIIWTMTTGKTDLCDLPDEKGRRFRSDGPFDSDVSPRLLAELLSSQTGQADQASPEEHHCSGLGNRRRRIKILAQTREAVLNQETNLQ